MSAWELFLGPGNHSPNELLFSAQDNPCFCPTASRWASLAHAYDRDAYFQERAQLSSLDDRDEFGNTLLHHAAMACSPGLLNLLIAQGHCVNVLNDAGVTPLVLAVARLSKAMVLSLLGVGADPKLCRKGAYDAVGVAVSHHSLFFVRLLLAQGAPIDARGKAGRTPYQTAIDNGHLGIADYLLRNGANPALLDQDGLNALMIAMLHAEHRVLRLMSKHPHFQAMIEHAASYDSFDGAVQSKKDNFKHAVAAMTGDLAILKIIWQVLKPQRRVSLCCFAAAVGQVAVVQWMVNPEEGKLAPNAIDADYSTLLRVAAYHGQDAVVEALKASGALYEETDKRPLCNRLKETVFDHIVQGGNPDVFRKAYMQSNFSCWEYSAAQAAADTHKAIEAFKEEATADFDWDELTWRGVPFESDAWEAAIVDVVGDSGLGSFDAAKVAKKHLACDRPKRYWLESLPRYFQMMAFEGYLPLMKQVLALYHDKLSRCLDRDTELCKALFDAMACALKIVVLTGDETMATFLMRRFKCYHKRPADCLSNVSVQLRKGVVTERFGLPDFEISPLSLAALCGASRMFELLIEDGANPNPPDNTGHTPFLFDLLIEDRANQDLSAISTHALFLFGLLIEDGVNQNPSVNPRYTPFLFNALVADGMNRHHPVIICHTPFLFACYAGSLPIAQRLADLGARKNALLKRDHNALHLAVIGGHLAVVTWLLETCPEMLNQTTKQHKKTPLILALEMLAPPHVIGQDNIGYTTETNPLPNSVGFVSVPVSDREAIVKVLLDNSPKLDCRALNGYTALAVAVWIGRADLVWDLKKRGASIDWFSDSWEPLLSVAVKRQWWSMLPVLRAMSCVPLVTLESLPRKASLTTALIHHSPLYHLVSSGLDQASLINRLADLLLPRVITCLAFFFVNRRLLAAEGRVGLPDEIVQYLFETWVLPEGFKVCIDKHGAIEFMPPCQPEAVRGNDGMAINALLLNKVFHKLSGKPVVEASLRRLLLKAFGQRKCEAIFDELPWVGAGSPVVPCLAANSASIADVPQCFRPQNRVDSHDLPSPPDSGLGRAQLSQWQRSPPRPNGRVRSTACYVRDEQLLTVDPCAVNAIVLPRASRSEFKKGDPHYQYGTDPELYDGDNSKDRLNVVNPKNNQLTSLHADVAEGLSQRNLRLHNSVDCIMSGLTDAGCPTTAWRSGQKGGHSGNVPQSATIAGKAKLGFEPPHGGDANDDNSTTSPMSSGAVSPALMPKSSKKRRKASTSDQHLPSAQVSASAAMSPQEAYWQILARLQSKASRSRRLDRRSLSEPVSPDPPDDESESMGPGSKFASSASSLTPTAKDASVASSLQLEMRYMHGQSHHIKKPGSDLPFMGDETSLPGGDGELIGGLRSRCSSATAGSHTRLSDQGHFLRSDEGDSSHRHFMVLRGKTTPTPEQISPEPGPAPVRAPRSAGKKAVPPTDCSEQQNTLGSSRHGWMPAPGPAGKKAVPPTDLSEQQNTLGSSRHGLMPAPSRNHDQPGPQPRSELGTFERLLSLFK